MSDTEDSTDSIGEKLREAREAAKLNQEDIANQLHLNLDIIKSLEKDDFDALAGPTFIRGYIRSYCKVISADPEPLVGLYNQIEPDKTIPDAQPMVSSAPTQISSQDKPVKLVTYVICIGLLILLLIWWQGNQGELPFLQAPPAEEEISMETDEVAPAFDYEFNVVDHNAPDETPTLAEQEVTTLLDDTGAMMGMDESLVDQLPSTDTMLSDISTDISTDITTDITTEVTSTLEPVDSSADSNTLTSNEDSETSSEESTESEAAAEPVTDEAVILFTLSKDSWIEVNDVDDKRLFINLVKADTELEVKGKPPLRVLLGNSDGVKVQYQGQEFDTSPFERAGIARFTLE